MNRVWPVLLAIIVTASMILAAVQHRNSRHAAEWLAQSRQTAQVLDSRLRTAELEQERRAASISAAEQELEALQLRIAELRTRLGQVQEQQHPEFEILWQQALEAAGEEITRRRAEEALSQRIQLERRLANLDLEARAVYLRIEYQYGDRLKALDISDQRRQQIIEALAEAQLEHDNMRASLAAGEIDLAEYELIMQGNTVSARLSQLLESGELEQLRNQREGEMLQNVSHMTYSRMLPLTPGLAPETRDLIATAYAQQQMSIPGTLGQQGEDYLIARTRWLVHEGIPGVREELRHVLSEEELRQLDNFLEHESAEQERQLRIRQAQLGGEPGTAP